MEEDEEEEEAPAEGTTEGGSDAVASAPAVNENKIKNIEIRLVNDKEKQIKMLIDGQLDILLEIDPSFVETLNKEGMLQASYVPLHFYALAFNTEFDKFANKKIRQGIAMAIDKSDLAKEVVPENQEQYINNGPFPHNDNRRYKKFPNRRPFDLKAAKKRLGSAQGLTTTLIYQEDEANIMERIANKISIMLNEVGIQVEPKGLGLAFESQLSNRTYELALVRHSGYTDGYNIDQHYYSNSPANVTGLNSPALDKLLLRWRNTAFWEERLPLALKVHDTLSDLSPYVYLFSLPTSAFYSPRLKNVKIVDSKALLGSVENWEVEAAPAPVE